MRMQFRGFKIDSAAVALILCTTAHGPFREEVQTTNSEQTSVRGCMAEIGLV
jgi:hypothetical protein